MLDRVPDWPEKEFTSAGKLATDYEALRVEEIAQVRRGDADVPSSIRDLPDAAGVASHRPRHDVVESERTVGVSQVLEDRRAARNRFEAPAVATSAHGSVFSDGGVAELASAAVMAALYLSIEDQSGTDVVTDLEENRVLLAPGCAHSHLCKSRQIRGIIDEDRTP